MRAVVFVVIFLLTAGFDQGTKQWALSLPPGEPQALIEGFWEWELAMNEGSAFSLLEFGEATQVLLAIFAIVCLIGIGIYAYRLRPDQRLERVALALVAGGALGNLIDRLRHGAVTDFIRWRWGEHRWPIFNVADAALVVGAILLLVAGSGILRHRARTT